MINWDSFISTKEKAAELASHYWNSTKIFASETAFPAIINFGTQASNMTKESASFTADFLKNFAKTHNITVDLAYQKFEEGLFVTTAGISSYCTTKAIASAIHTKLFTITQFQTVAQPFAKHLQALLNILANPDNSIKNLDQLNALISLMEDLASKSLLPKEVRESIFVNYKAYRNAVTNGQATFEARNLAMGNLQKLANGLYDLITKNLPDFKTKIGDIQKATEGNQVFNMLNSLQRTLKGFYSETIQPARSNAVIYISALASAVALVASNYYTRFVKFN